MFYLLPHQLFLPPKSERSVVLWEHPDFFTKYRFNKKKLLLHRASMRAHADMLRGKGVRVRYVNFDADHTVAKKAVLYDPIHDMPEFAHAQVLDSPNFLCARTDLDKIYREKFGKDSMRFTTYFYPRVKAIVGVLERVSSKDAQNRKAYRGAPEVPPLPKGESPQNKYVAEARRYVNGKFADNPGHTKDFVYPIDRPTALAWLRHFVKHRLEHFGPYQDWIAREEPWMFHSVLSSSLNIGLLRPDEVVRAIVESAAPIASVEGYVRQLIWREYQRYCYVYLRDVFRKRNRFDTNAPLTKAWYDGTTGVLPVDACVKKAFDTGYLHHIERLMVMGNFMLLSEIRREEGFKWFMEFAIDSYEWVMYQNVYDMVFFSTGGKTTHKAYITSSNYVRKMSDYPKGEWTDEWDRMYRAFKKRHF